MSKTLETLKTHLGQVADLKAATAVLEWDLETYLPEGASGVRAQQLATLSALAHERFTDDEVGQWLTTLQDQAPDLSEEDQALLRVTQRDFDRARKLPSAWIGQFAETTARSRDAWKAAREQADFTVFAPHLEKIIALNREKAEILGYDDHLYDALLDEFEPAMKTAEVTQIFADLRRDLVPIVHAISDQSPVKTAFLHQAYDPQKQWDFGMDVLADFGYNFRHGRQDKSAHPFTTSFSIHDVRVTTRIAPDFLPSGLFGTLHECGHGLYEQGINPALDRTPLADGTSLGMHESQSRLWENLVGRSRPFWHAYYPKLQALFPSQLQGISLDTFYRGINAVAPSLIRVEADEVTYNLHIMVRFEMEKALLSGETPIAEAPDLWNTRMAEYLGLRPQNDAEGILQDIHWSLGAFGYFPTYALGNLMSAQLFAQLEADLPDVSEQMAEGQFGPILDWLRIHIHHYGRMKTATELLLDTTGQMLNATAWLDYIRTKYSEIYTL